MLNGEEVNRLFSLDAFIFIPLVVIFFHLILIKEKEWKAMIVFQIAGVLNFLIEIGMLMNGTRFVETNDVFLILLTLFTLSWIDIGFFTAIAYININYMFKNSDMDRLSLILANLLFFVGMPIASINWGIYDFTLLTGRIVASPIVQLSLQVSAIVLVSVILLLTGYRRLLSRALLNGVVLGISFQTRLYLAGIRQASNMSVETLIIDSLTLATMPIAAGLLFCILFRQVKFTTFGDAPPLPARVMNLRITLAAAKVLFKSVGFKTTISLVKELGKQRKQGEPWKALPPPQDLKDNASRKLIGDAILLYRALSAKMGKDKAEKIIKQTILESAIMQLYSMVPRIDKTKILSKPTEERERSITNLVEKFPNTDWELLEASETSFAYRITRCRLVDLVIELGYPELRDAFCPGDAIYFERFQPDIVFSRPQNIGEGDKCCDFIFELKD